MNIAFDEMMI